MGIWTRDDWSGALAAQWTGDLPDLNEARVDALKAVADAAQPAAPSFASVRALTLDVLDAVDGGFLVPSLGGFGTGPFLSAESHAPSCPCGAHDAGDKLSAAGTQGGPVYAVGPEIGDTTGTARALAIGASYISTIEVPTDSDWYRVTLEAGKTYMFTVNGAGTTPLSDSILTLRGSNGSEIAFNDDANGLNSAIRFTATTSGTYYLDVGGYNDQDQTSTGDYTVAANEAEPLSLFNYDQIANQLTNGYWGGTQIRWDATQGSTITVNITALDATYRFYATEALSLWSDITGITFRQVLTGGQIVFDDTDEGAYASTESVGNFTTSATINVSTNWSGGAVGDYNSYTFQTFIHEIGHVLGLGHAGNYNGDANYANDALYLNDAWSTTVMSYFSQSDNSYFGQQGFTQRFVLSPMVADILAMQNLYGLSTTTRVTDTTYGFGNTSGRAIYDAATNGGAAYAIFDAGGIDTLNYSRHTQDQLINLNAETFSNVGGSIGNVAIARGTVIENAIGGSGDDTLIGNDANNRLDGRGGTNRLEGGAGDDVYVIASTTNTIVEAGGGGVDTIEASVGITLGANVENALLTGTGALRATGNTLANTLTGNSGANTLLGLAGADRLDGRAGADRMEGGTGSDQYWVDNAGDVIIEAAGSSAGGADRVNASIDHVLAANVERLTLIGSVALIGTGNDLSNRLAGNTLGNTLSGLGGDDWIDGGAGRDIMTGGLGSDRFVFDDGDFSGVTAGTADRIVDWSGDDLLDLSRVDAATGGADSAFAWLGTGGFTGVAGQLRYQQSGASTVVMGDLNGDAKADFWIALTGTHALAASDFLL